MTVDARWVEEAARRTTRRTGQRAIIEADWPCPKCSYNLKGLKKPGACPECGTRYGESPIDTEAAAIHYEPLHAAALRVLTPGVSALIVGGWLLIAGLGAPVVFGLLPSLAPTSGSPLRLGVLAAIGVFAVPGTAAWLLGVWMITLSPASRAEPARDDGLPAPGSLAARPVWMIWSARGCAPGLLGGALGLCLALWPGMTAYEELFSTVAMVCLAVGALGTLPLVLLISDLCERAECDEPRMAASFAVWVLPAGGAGLALAHLLPHWLGWLGSLIGGLGWMCGWVLIPMAAAWLWSLRPLRAALARRLGVASALEPVSPARR